MVLNSPSMFSAPTKRWRLQEAEVYSKLYYKSRVEPAVCEHLKTLDSDVADLSIIRKVTRQVWEGEDTETKVEVAARVAKVQEVAIEPDENRTPQQYQE